MQNFTVFASPNLPLTTAVEIIAQMGLGTSYRQLQRR